MPPQKQEFFGQTDDSSLEPAGCVMQLAGKGGHAGGDQCQRCLLAAGTARAGAGAGAAPGPGARAALGRDSRADPQRGAGAVFQHPVSQTGACRKFLHAQENVLPLPLPSASAEPSLHTAVGVCF